MHKEEEGNSNLDWCLIHHGLSQVLPEYYSSSSLLFHIPHVHIETTAFGLFRLKK